MQEVWELSTSSLFGQSKAWAPTEIESYIIIISHHVTSVTIHVTSVTACIMSCQNFGSNDDFEMKRIRKDSPVRKHLGGIASENFHNSQGILFKVTTSKTVVYRHVTSVTAIYFEV